MQLADPGLYRNGTAAIAMPIYSVDIDLEEIGYPGWHVVMRTNPRASTWDAFVSGEAERWWKAFGQIVLEWNLADEDGKPLPLPRDVGSQAELDLPIRVLNHMVNSYTAAFVTDTAVPKGPSVSSSDSSSTSGDAPSSEAA